jgi:hypothetical protein
VRSWQNFRVKVVSGTVIVELKYQLLYCVNVDPMKISGSSPTPPSTLPNMPSEDLVPLRTPRPQKQKEEFEYLRGTSAELSISEGIWICYCSAPEVG